MLKKSVVAISDAVLSDSRAVSGEAVQQILNALLATMKDGAFVLADEGDGKPVIIEVSHMIECWTGLHRDKICGRLATDLFILDDGAISGTHSGKGVLKDRAGDGIPVDVTICELPENPAIRIAALRPIDDMTGFLARTVAEKTAAENSRDDFFARISHDLRTPLNGILGFSEIMQKGIFGEIEHDRYRGYAKDIHEAGQTLMKKVDELLEISALAKEPVKIDCFSISSLLSEIINSRDTVSGKQVDILTGVPGNLPDIHGEMQSIARLIEILLENAIDTVPDESRISVYTSMDEDRVILTIEDQGSPPGHPVADIFARSEADRGWHLTMSQRSQNYLDLMQFLCQRTGIQLATKGSADGGHIISVRVPRAQQISN